MHHLSFPLWDDIFMKMLYDAGFPKDAYPTPAKVFEIKENGKFKYENEIRYWIKNILGNGLTRKGFLFEGSIKGTTMITMDNKNQQYLFKELLNDEINSISECFKIHIVNSDEYSSIELINSIKKLEHGIYGRILIIVDQLRVGANIEYEVSLGKNVNDLHTIIKLDSTRSYSKNFQTDGRLFRFCIGKSLSSANSAYGKLKGLSISPIEEHDCACTNIPGNSSSKNFNRSYNPVIL